MTESARFDASEYHEDGALRPAEFGFQGSPRDGWTIRRNGRDWLALGPGYRLLRALQCGVCSTDLDRRHLPFPLPQVIGHEVLAADEDGRRHVVEINASHHARGVDAACPFCDAGLPTHCPERLVLGIHALPGGFGPWVLAPVHAALPVPDELPSDTAVLVEPFAAALHAVETIAPRAGDRIAVLGPRRLGMLVIAALRAWRERRGTRFEIAALARRPELLDLAGRLGADHLVDVGADSPPAAARADVVIDTTGNPEGLVLALELARREVHLKSTCGRPAGGLVHATELVVDEIAIRRFEGGEPLAAPGAVRPPRVAWLAPDEPPRRLTARADVRRHRDAAAALRQLAEDAPDLPRADAAVVATAAGIDAAVRPLPDREVSLVRPRGAILVLDTEAARAGASVLARAVAERGLRITTSRCGDFAAALDLMASAPSLRRLGDDLVTHRFDRSEIARAFDTARSTACVKAVVTHGA